MKNRKKYPCTIKGVYYESEQVAADALGINTTILRNRLRSKKFPEYTSEYYHKIRLYRVSCVVAEVEYESITSAVKKLGISYGEMIKRLHSFDYPDYVSARHPKIRYTPKNLSISCTINGIEYKSLANGAKDLGITSNVLKNRLRSPNFPDYISEHHPKRPRGSTERKTHSCTIGGIEYESLSAAAKGLGISLSTLKNRLLSPNFPDYASKHYPKRPVEIKKLPCTVDGTEYESLSAAAKDLGIGIETLKHRLRSPNFPDHISKHHPKRPLKSPERKTRSCTIGGIEYESLVDAAKNLGISTQTLGYRLGSSNFPGYVKSE